MNIKTYQQIEIPEGYEVDKITFKEIEKKPTYKDVANDLFKSHLFNITSIGEIFGSSSMGCEKYNPNNATSIRQLQKLLALNMLMNVAKWLNQEKEEAHYCIDINHYGILGGIFNTHSYGQAQFTSREAIRKAIEILGEECVRLALTTDY